MTFCLGIMELLIYDKEMSKLCILCYNANVICNDRLALQETLHGPDINTAFIC